MNNSFRVAEGRKCSGETLKLDRNEVPVTGGAGLRDFQELEHHPEPCGRSRQWTWRRNKNRRARYRSHALR